MEKIFSTRDTCPGCGNDKATRIFSAPLLDPNVRIFVSRKILDSDVLARFKDTQYALMKCACGLIYQENILSDAYLSKMYGEWMVHTYQDREPSKRFTYYANELYVVASLFSKPMSETRVLDYGLGSGDWAKVAVALGFDVYGTDLSSALVDGGSEQGIKMLEIDKISQHQFDFINTEQVFEHLARPRETLSLLADSLSKDGIVKISVPDGRGIEKRIPLMDWSAPRNSKGFLMPATPLVHINTFTDRSIKHMGRVVGLSPIKPKLRNEYALLDTTSLRALIKCIVRPVYRRWHGSAYVFLRADD